MGLETAVFSQLGGVTAAVAAVEARAGVILDPAMAASFVGDCRVVGRPRPIVGDPCERLLEIEPAPVIERDLGDVVTVARAFGDLADLKVPCMHGHSQAVARLAVGAARRLGMDGPRSSTCEIAALLHDVGRVGVSNAIWEKARAADQR